MVSRVSIVVLVQELRAYIRDFTKVSSDSAGGGRAAMVTPRSIPATPGVEISPPPQVMSRSLEIPLVCRGQGFNRLGRLQLQIRTLTQRLYQLGTGEKESFRHARARGSLSRNTGLGVRFCAPLVWLVPYADSIR